MKYFLLFIGIVLLFYASLWFTSRKTYPVEYGVSFNQDHAGSLGLDWKDVYSDTLEELQPKYIRVAAMWSKVEAERDVMNFEEVDWMMEKAAEYNVKVILVVGQKAPRWPECHIPQWVSDDRDKNKEELLAYVKAIIERYKDHKALEFWQVENEPFIKFRFGECAKFNESFIFDEIKLVRKIDSNHKIILTDSGEMGFWNKAIKYGDYFGTTLYRIVRNPSGSVWNYDWLPPSTYRYKAKIWKQDLNKMFVVELQAEPWFTSSNPNDTPLEIQEQTMNPDRLTKHLDYAEHIGVPRVYLWGVEWWYWVKEARGDTRYWNIIKNRIKDSK